MSSSSSTTPAKRGTPAPRTGLSSHSAGRAALAWGLFSLWLVLMGFGLVSAIEPQWLKDLSQAGREVESRDYKDYGDNMLKKANYAAAIAQYQIALSIKPDLTAASVNMAVAWDRLGKSDAAERILRQALTVEGGQKGVVYFHLAAIAEKQGKIAQAIELYQQAIGTELPPHAAYAKLGKLYIMEKRFAEARDALETALKIQENPVSLYQDMLRASLATYADDPDHLQVIEAGLVDENYSEELAPYDIEMIRQSQSRDEDISSNYANLSAAYAQMGDIERAIEYTQKALQIWPDNTSAKSNLEILYRTRNQPAAANAKP